MDPEVLEDERTSKREMRYGAAILKDRSDPYYALRKEFSDVVSDDPPSVLPPDRGVRHEIDLVPGTKYCTTRQWPLPKEQVDVIDAFFAAKHAAGMVRESESPHSSPTFCVRKPNGKWRMVHAFNKLNAATIPASTPIPRKDVLQSNMAGCTVFSALDMVDGYYQLLMRESDIPLTATYVDGIFVHSRASEGKTAVEAHLDHLREVRIGMRENRLYANINKCIFGAEEIPFLGCFLGKFGVRADPKKVCAIAQWPVPVSQKDLRKWLGLANYLHKYSANYAEMARPLTNLLKKDAVWSWTSEAQQAFEAIKSSLQSAPILALPDEDRPFSVVCDASDFAIGCALLQVDADGRERVVSFQSRQLKAAEKNYPVHDKELFAMKYALVKFRVHLLGQQPFVIYTDHASLRTATSSPHLSQRMARWLSFFTEYNFTVEYKPGKQNVLADALSRRLDYELAHLAYLESPLYELIREAYADDDDLAGLVEALSAPNKVVELTARQRSRLHRYSVVEGLLYYQVDGGDEPRIVVPNDEDLRHRVLYEAHDTQLSGHLGREKTYTSVARNFWWPHMYKWVPPARPPHPEGGVKSSPDDGFDGWRLGNPRRPRRPKQLQLRLQPRRPHGTLVVQQHRLRSCSKNHHPHARDLRRRHPDGRPVSAVGAEPHATSDEQLLDRTRAVTTVVVTRHRRRCHQPVSCAQPVGRRLSFRSAQLARVVLTSKTASFQRGGRYPSPIFARSSTPSGVVFPRVPHFGWCDCEVPCRVGRCRNLLMQLYCNVNCCPYGGNCGNSVVESTEVALVKNVVARQLAVVAQEFIAAGVILGEYLGEIEHVSASRTARPRNECYRLVMTQRPETPSHSVRVAVNAQHMGGLMRFVNHSCSPVARFLEVANGRRTAVVVATTHAIYEGDEITVDYGPDLWFVCRCGHANCRHRDIQNEQDP
ncbi:hypothetical protein PR001_g9543 [Phytophthora rubi]|uniref:SET domain-containing protein n=1 Tax=Phytophthora rubi TaxID=129364 RepID=A0A6A3N085_9STRA|nr:hypothetical protein PR001_g9543 [Phytophthora rubi]